MILRRSIPEFPRDGEIRKAERRDIPRLVELWLELMATHAEKDERFRVSSEAAQVMTRRFQYLVTDRDTFVLASLSGAEVVGFAVGHIDTNLPFFTGSTIGFISDIVVVGAHRRQGRAARMIGLLREWFRMRKVSCIQLHAASCNPEAREFWLRMGFADYLVRMWADV